MKSRLLLGKKLLVILLAVATTTAYSQHDPRFLNVLATSGLNMRTAPEAHARIVTKVPFGKTVEILEVEKGTLQIGWIKDHWYRVRFRGREGFIFGGYLSGLPAPVGTIGASSLPEMLTAYCTNSFRPEGAPVLTEEIGRTNDTLHHSLQRYAGAIELEVEREADRNVARILLPFSVEKTYVLLEALLKQHQQAELLDRLRFVKGQDGGLERISTADGTIDIHRSSADQVQLQLVSYPDSLPER